MQARYYDPVIGRFYSNDPLGFRDVHSFNRYAYANNNPYKYIDPTGMSSEKGACGSDIYLCLNSNENATDTVDGASSLFRGVGRYIRHEMRMTGQSGNGEAIQANYVEASLFGEALGLALHANQNQIDQGIDLVNLSFVTGRQATALTLGILSGGGFGASGSLSLLASAGDAYHGVELLAKEFDLNIRTVDVNNPLLPQIKDENVKRALESKLLDIGTSFVSGTGLLGNK